MTTHPNSFDQAHGGPFDARDLTDLIAATRKRLRLTWLVSGAALVVVATLGWLLVATGIDMIAPMPVPMRVLAAAVLWLMLSGTLIMAVLWPTLRPLRDMRVARLIEAVLPSIKNRLISSLDLHQRSQNNGATINRNFYERLLNDTRSRLAKFRIDMVASPRTAIRSSATAAGVILLAIVMAILFNESMPAAVARVLRPTAPIPPVSHLRIAAPCDLSALLGDPLRVEATLTRGDTDSLVIKLKSDTGDWVRYPMTKSAAGSFVFDFSRLQESYLYQIEGGGTWTRPRRITALLRPVVEDVAATVYLPDYMALPDPQPVPADATQISVPEGGSVIVSAAVANAPTAGRVLLLTQKTQTTQQLDEREVVWFDDRAPADAQITDDATWAPQPAHSGAASLLLDESRQRFGFTTRLSQFHVPKDQAVMLYLRADPISPPTRITLALHAATAKKDIEWTIDGDELTPGQWVRIDRSVSDLQLKLKDDIAILDGITITAEGGRVHIDRIGSLHRTDTASQTTTLEPAGELSMIRDAATGRWTARIPVDKDVSFALQFTNDLGHASAEMEPMPIIATADQPPSVIVEKPGQMLTLKQIEPVPVVTRALDDYGVEAIGITFDDNSNIQWLRHYDQPQRAQLAMSAIDVSAHGLAIDKPVTYAMAVRDRKGQVTLSPKMQITLAPPTDNAAAAEGKPLAAGLLDGLSKLLSLQGKIASLPEELLGNLALTERGKVELTPDADLSQEQMEQLTQLQKLVQQQQQLARDLSKQFDKAADEATQSPLTTTAEAEALEAMQQELSDLAQQGSPMSAEDAAALQEMARQLEQLDAAKQQLTGDAAAAEQQMLEALARIQAQQSAQQLSRLNDYLQAQQQQIEAMAREVGQLQQQAQVAPTAEVLRDVSQQQEQLDPKAIEAMRQAMEMMRAGQQPIDQAPPAPWTPPGQRIEGHPVEEDTPEETPTPTPQQAGQPQQPQQQEQQNWWDQPVDAPPEAVTLEQNERFADRQRPTEAPPPLEPGQGGQAQPPPPQDGPFQQQLTENSNDNRAGGAPAAQTPRQMLINHQGQMQQSLQQTAAGLSQAQQQVGQMAQSLQSMAQSPAGAAGQLSQMMNSQQMAAAAAMAATAAQQGQQASQGGPQGSGGLLPPTGVSLGPDSVQLRAGMLITGELGNLPPGHRATLYRLPPQVRQPLLRGMTEKGPDGYQPLIDAYFRSLLDEEPSP